jgi:ClpX C4-type zinc finger
LQKVVTQVKIFEGQLLPPGGYTQAMFTCHIPNTCSRPEVTPKKCTFCLKAENEVNAMAKYKSGFNICNKCIKLLQSAEEE